MEEFTRELAERRETIVKELSGKFDYQKSEIEQVKKVLGFVIDAGSENIKEEG